MSKSKYFNVPYDILDYDFSNEALRLYLKLCELQSQEIGGFYVEDDDLVNDLRFDSIDVLNAARKELGILIETATYAPIENESVGNVTYYWIKH